MTELAKIFAELGISLYLDEFIEQGFDTWETILDITESDFDALGVKLGHRRKLQRKIANSRGLSSDRALASPRNTPIDDGPIEDQKAVGERPNGKDGAGAPQATKRKYRRHPKHDENSPERPPSAYVIFSNKMREELKGRNLSFTEIAKLVGENWQSLSPGGKEPYEQQAFSGKERYNNKLTEYKKTENYKNYSQYLAEFKARQANQPQAPELETAKRPKLEPHVNTASSSTASSSTSISGVQSLVSRGRFESSASKNNALIPLDGHAQHTVLPKLNKTQILPHGPTSPNASSSPVLPGYREAIFAGSPQGSPWGDTQREDGAGSQRYTRIATNYDRRTRYPSVPGADSLNLTGSFQHAHRTGIQNHPPPLLSSESTNKSTVSSTSTGSSHYFSPRTPLEPLEPLLDRSLPLPSMYSLKSNGSDNQLSALRQPSLSPQTISMGQQSPPSMNPHVDYPAPISIAPIRGYTSASSQNMAGADNPDPRARLYPLQNPADDILDPVSALLRAGEIVNRNSRSQQPPGHPQHHDE